MAITGHLVFAFGDVTACGRKFDWYEGDPQHLYHEALQCGAMSFVLAYEADRKMVPWMWPSCLVGGCSDKPTLQRISLGDSIWFPHEEVVRRWVVTGWTTDELRLTITETTQAKKCETCKQENWSDRDQKKVVARLKFTRESWQAHVERLESYRTRGILESGGLVSWNLTPHQGRMSDDEAAWQGQFIGAWNRPEYGHAKLQDGLLLKSRGLVVHGATLREARGTRKAKLQWWDREVRIGLAGRSYSYSYPDEREVSTRRLDEPLPVLRLKAAAERYGGVSLPAIARKRLKGDTVTIRQLLIGSTDPSADACKLRDLLANYDQGLSREQAAERELARNGELLAKLEASRHVTVLVSDSLEIGNCPMGTMGWLLSYFPDIVPKSLHSERDYDTIRDGLKKIKARLTVGQILDNKAAAALAMPVLQYAIRKRSEAA